MTTERKLMGRELFGPKEALQVTLEHQLDNFLEMRQDLLEKRRPREARERFFLQRNFSAIISERNERAKAVLSPEGKKSKEIAERLMPEATYFVDCIDSRVMRTIKYGMPLGVGGAIRRPAGKMSEFRPAVDGGLVLEEGSYFAELLDTALEKNNKIAQVLDSHLGCAAQEKKEKDKGKRPKDKGLYQDVLKKKEMGKAMQEYAAAHHPGKKIMPIQTSFNPEDGFMYMGLERDESLAVAKQNDGFTDEVLDQLVAERKIIHTKSLIQDPLISAMFAERPIDNFDWERNYRETTDAFWNNIDDMVNEGLLDHVAGYVEDIYPDAEEAEIQERTMLLTLNAYSGYNLNRTGEYPHSAHKESCVVVSEGEHGPYGENSSFSVFSKAINASQANVDLAAGIVRANRETGRITDNTGQYTSTEDFTAAPVPVLHKVIIREDVDWDNVRKAVWSEGFLPKQWHAMDNETFIRHVGKKAPNLPVSVVTALSDMRREVAALYDSNHQTGEQIFDGHLEVVPAFVDKNRKLHTLVPFVHEGYSRS